MEAKSTISYPIFASLDLRVGLVITAEIPEWSHKLLALTIDFGEGIGQRSILSGVREWYSPGDLIGKKFAFLVNLEAKKMGEGVSEGMMFMFDTAEQPQLWFVPDNIPVGTVIR